MGEGERGSEAGCEVTHDPCGEGFLIDEETIEDLKHFTEHGLKDFLHCFNDLFCLPKKFEVTLGFCRKHTTF